MRLRKGLLLLALAVLVSSHSPAGATDVNPEDLRPGLVATYQDTVPAGVTLCQLEPTIGFALKKGEAVHPRLAAQGGTIRWAGYLNIARAGSYRFSAVVQGDFRLSVAGKEVLHCLGNDETDAVQRGAELRLEGGVWPLTAEFRRTGAKARVELLWQAPFFHEEPLPFDQLGHLPAQEPAPLARDQAAERGRFLVEELNCIRCHLPSGRMPVAEQLSFRQAPDLSQAGRRLAERWIYNWLGDPQHLHPGATMPKLFRPDEAGDIERFAVARFLASLGGPIRVEPADSLSAEQRERSTRGRQLFATIGCLACHPAPDAARQARAGEESAGVRHWDLRGMGQKTSVAALKQYLLDPLVTDPSGRMPRMRLNDDEAQNLAEYLSQGPARKLGQPPAGARREQLQAAFAAAVSSPAERERFAGLPETAQVVELGKQLVIARRCTNCHTISKEGKALPSVPASATFEGICQAEKMAQGCLPGDGSRSANSPVYSWPAGGAEAVREFLRSGTNGAGSAAPIHSTRVTIERLNCLACHSRDGRGGLTPALVEDLRRHERAENGEAVSPPPLTGVGHKLLTPWLRQVLQQGGQARPWMGLRMPQFGDANVRQLPETLAAAEGAAPDEKPQLRYEGITAKQVEAGRLLIGKQAFGCISCHDLAGIPNAGTRGPDLESMHKRVRFEWYRRWLEQPQRMQPGTRMPTVFPDGKTTLPKVLAGNVDAQAEALWIYCAISSFVPLPEGMEKPRNGLVLEVKQQPIILRTFLPEVSPRSIAVGYPGAVAVAFDLETCRLAYAWSGPFLDASPAWDDRGGNPANVLGHRFWTSPAGVPWAVTSSLAPPDFAALAQDPAQGAQMPEGQVYAGPRAVQFVDYRLDKKGRPVFRYRLQENGTAVEITERPEPLRQPSIFGLARHFTLDLAAGKAAWLNAAEGGREPRLLDAHSLTPARIPGQASGGEHDAAGHLLVLPQGDGRALVLAAPVAPAGARWNLRQANGKWQARLAIPPAKAAGSMSVVIHLWSIPRDEPALIKDLLSAK